VVNTKTQTKKEEPQEERQYEARPKNTTKLQIRNLQFGTSKEDLHDLGRRFGTIVLCEVNKGNGFITYAKPDEAQLALSQLDALSFRGYTLRVQFAREPLPSKDKKTAEDTPTTTTATTTTTTTTTTAGQKPEAKKEEKKLTFAQQQQLAKSKPQAPKQTFTQPAETPKVEQTQNNNNNQQGKGQQQQQQGQGKKKGQQQQNKQQQQQQQQAEAKKNELRSYKVSVEKTVLQEGDKKEEGFTFSVNHQQYLDYIIPLLKDIQSKKEQENGSK
jgi:RNA recognition motif-containing protein